MPCLATLDELRRHLGLRAGEIDDNARLLAVLAAASAELERDCGRHFEPRFAALPHKLEAADDLLSLGDDLLILSALADSSGVIPLAVVERLPAEGPAALLRLNNGWNFTGEVIVTGWWGWHDEPAALWASTSQAISDDPLTAEATLITVADTAAFSAGQLLRAGAEIVRVQAVHSAPDQLVAARGQQGTLAVSHAQGTVIDIYAPPPDVRDLLLRRAAWLARRSEPLPADLRTPALRWRRERV